MKTNDMENLPPASKKGRCSGRTAKHKLSNDKTAAATQEEYAKEDRLAEEVTQNLFITKATKDGYDGLEALTSNLINLSLDRMDGKVRGMYERYQKLWKDFVNKHGCDMMSDDAMIAFMSENAQKYKAGTLWVIYSCINKMYIMDKGVNLNTWPRLRALMKTMTEKYVAKKANTFSPEQVDEIICNWSESFDPRLRMGAVHIMLSYYGLLRMGDAMKIRKEDVSFDTSQKCWKVTFNYERKRKNVGFSYLIPSQYNKYVEAYHNEVHDWTQKELSDRKKETEDFRFLRNFHTKGRTRLQNAGEHNLSKFAVEAAVHFGIDPTSYSNHSWRRSAATNLADAGVSLTNLKRMGQWNSDKSAEGYIANSLPLRLERMNKLLPQDDVPSAKKK